VLTIVTGNRRRPLPWIGGIAAIAVAVAASTWLLAVPANPMTYVASPVRYTTGAIARGGALFAQHCASCHGALGRGDGPSAASLAIRPSDLAEHMLHHRAGDLYWQIAHGIPDTPMPGFAAALSERDLWNVVAFVRALSDRRAVRTMTSSVMPWRPIVAPDFTFESGEGQESLGQLRSITLLVLYTLPQSLARLSELEAETQAYASAGTRVIALPMQAAVRSEEVATAHRESSIVVVADPDVAAVYATFARQSAGTAVGEPTHLEFLIDRQGYLRARWLGIPDQAALRTSEILAQAELLKREPPRPPAGELHAH